MARARIMIVEDDRIVARDIEQQLSRIGYEVVGHTTRGEDAPDIARSARPDLILMDIRLEGETDGIEAARRIRDDFGLPIVFLTAYADDETVRRASRAEPYGYILKPFEDSQLRTVVEMALYKHAAERRLRESERRFSVTLESIGDAVIAVDDLRRITFINPVAQRLTGWLADDALGKHLDVVYQIDRQPETRGCHDSDVATDSSRQSSTVELVTRDGRILQVDQTISPIVDSNGDSGAVLVFRDVTFRRRAEEANALRVAHDRLEHAMRGSQIGVWDVDMPDGTLESGRVRLLNIWEWMGYARPRELIGFRYLIAVVHPGDREIVARAVRAYLSGDAPEFHVEMRVRHRDGRYRFVLARGILVRESERTAVRLVGSLVDISRLRDAERALRASEGRYRGTFENAAIGISLCSLDGRYQRVNEHYCDILRRKREDLLKIGFQNVVYSEDLERTCAKYELLKEGKIRNYSEELRLVRGDASLVWVNVTVSLQHDEHGGPTNSIAIVHDLTVRKQLEHDVRVAKEAAEAANRAKDEFLANVSHELRTPLNGILGYAQILKRDTSLTHTQRGGLDVIEQSGEHLLTLINDILDFARIEADKLELNLTDIPLEGFLRVISDIIRVRAEEKDLRFQCTMAADLPGAIRADERRLRQVLLNLLANAVKFTDEGEVQLYVSKVSDSSLRFEVLDTGIGIGQDRLEAIFQPFEQAGDLRRRSGGTGLGLAISRQLVRMMGGDIYVISTLGKGSTFWFDLEGTCLLEDMPRMPVTRFVTGYEGRRRLVLVVDDVQANRAVMVEVLEQLGFRTIEAEDGAACMELARACKPDLILMDVVLPGIDGVETIQRLRGMPHLGAVPIIAISANASAANERNSLVAGANHFLPKPVDLDLLVQKMSISLPLKWTYPDDAQPPYEADSDSPMVVPNTVELSELHRLALIGMMREIVRYAKQLVEKEPSYGPFSLKVSQLAERYDSQAVLALIEQALGKDGSS
ncbi:hypothetical protein WT13_32080 [Burkholderia anthina]|nr:hypothetical protein WT13_32080 [Burkholderia anthina]